ncbi:MAG: hypothetical protein AB2598_07615 [Candidatus Thiodiazotropha sp.]
MRKSTMSALVIQGLAVVLLSAASNILADDRFTDGMIGANIQQLWVCDYTRSADDVLYLRCDDMVSLFNDPLIMEDAPESSTKFIPIWRRSNNEQSAVRLAESVLCNGMDHCSAEMKSLFSPGRFAIR